MNHYALMFRATRDLTEEEKRQRATEIQAWVQQVREKGITLDPRNFQMAEANFYGEDGAVKTREGSGDASLTTIVFFDSEDREQAVNLARVHPGLRYGVTVEVREWRAP